VAPRMPRPRAAARSARNHETGDVLFACTRRRRRTESAHAAVLLLQRTTTTGRAHSPAASRAGPMLRVSRSAEYERAAVHDSVVCGRTDGACAGRKRVRSVAARCLVSCRADMLISLSINRMDHPLAIVLATLVVLMSIHRTKPLLLRDIAVDCRAESEQTRGLVVMHATEIRPTSALHRR
jgi:hypothetical protein